jgi:hypothetical protein
MARTYPSTGSQPPSVELTVRQGPQPGQRFSLTQPTISIGREMGNDVVVSDPQISRRHASLTWDGRQFIIQDLGSANGTFVNGVRLTAPQVLQPGDVVGLGSTVLLGFQASPPVVSPSAGLRTGPVEPPAPAPSPPAKRRRRVLVPMIALLGLCGLLVVAAALGYFFLWPRPEARPMVLIRSPRHGDQVEVGQEVTVHSMARDEGKVVRVELWVDDQLQEAQASTLPGGASPFPLLARWQPPSPGTHTLIVRAFNAQGARAHASVNVEAIERADRDGDGIPDADDACPDEPGLPEQDGCPTPGDSDGDGTPDAEDECPEEPGSAEHAGCADGDGDGIRDRDDACPGEAGLPGHAGCPDQDGDGVRDRDDACPDVPGPAPSGCPDTGAGDRDGDHIPNDVDLAPDEPGLPEHGGSPPPGGGRDADQDGIPDDEEPPSSGPVNFGDLVSGGAVNFGEPVPELVLVEFQALEFQLGQEYDSVQCYASLAGGDMQLYGPFEPLGERRWNIAEYLGGENSRQIALPAGEPLEVRVECGAYVTAFEEPAGDEEGIRGEGGEGYYNLGSFTRWHLSEEWDGRRLQVRSERETEPLGRTFLLDYRICADSCEASPLPPPIASLVPLSGNMQLAWEWEGDLESIDEFRLRYHCGPFRGAGLRAPKEDRSISIQPFEPRYGETCEWYVTAYRMSDGAQSPRSNIVVWESEAGRSSSLNVQFRRVQFMHDASVHNRGPIYGEFWANDQVLRFDAATPGPFFYEYGYRTPSEAGMVRIQDLFDWIRAELRECPACDYEAPWYDQVSVTLAASDDLTVGFRIVDYNRETVDQVICEASETISVADLLSQGHGGILFPDMATGAQCDLFILTEWGIMGPPSP